MKKVAILPFIFSLFFHPVFSQDFTDSNLPIVVITTDNGAEIKDNPRIMAVMKIISRGPGSRNFLSDQNNPIYLNYNGRIDIEIRGSSTQDSEKKQYGLTTLKTDNITNNNVSLLGMAEENDWILNGMTFDPALIRDYLTYNLSRRIGEYASAAEYCELVINGNYRGLYLLQEKIKADKNRVNVTKIDQSDNQFPDVTGGYITKADKTTGGDPVAWSMLSWFGTSVDFIHVLPKPQDVTASQNDYIRDQFQALQTASVNGETSLTSGFPSVIDIPSFIDYIIINELASNADAYQYSTFFHKDRNGKLRAGPVWDTDLTYGNDLFFWGYDRSKTNIWQLSNRENDGARFWKELFNNPKFRCYISKRWNELTRSGEPLSQANIEMFIDLTVAKTGEAAGRDYTRWGRTGNYAKLIEDIKTFVSLRISWINSNIGPCSDCVNVPVPPLVITKIDYHPVSSLEFPDSEDLEFIEIENNSEWPVDLTGIYFSGTGFVFQFPAGSSAGPHSSMILAGNPSAFYAKHGFAPFGRFSRSLSNKGENLVIADAFGNIIDNVHYSDTLPWPDADGNGYYLKLTSRELDNNDPANWRATNELITSDKKIAAGKLLHLYPNPAGSFIRISDGTPISRVELFDIYGRLIISHDVSTELFEFDISRLAHGVYFIRIKTATAIYNEKVIKE